MVDETSTILVVEDDPSLRESISEILAEYYEILSAEDGKAALDIIEQTLPDLILSDIGMPRLSGFDMLETVRGRRETASLPVIMLSARGDRESVRHCMELGADDYIPKPFKAEEVLRAVRSRLSRQDVLRRPIDELQETLSLSLPHEFRTPLNGVLGFAGLIEDLAAAPEPIDKAELAEFAGQINASGTRLLRLVEKFTFHARVLTKAYSEQGTSPKDPVSAKGWTSAAVEQARSIASRVDRGEDLSVSFVSADVAIDTGFLAHVVGELLENALAYSDPGSLVMVTGEVVDGHYHIVVADSGRGMSKEQVANIGPYVQFDRKIHEQQGLGLGLATVCQIVRLYHGDMNIESMPNAGTTVRVSFPLAREERR